jgi:hypothetical protein
MKLTFTFFIVILLWSCNSSTPSRKLLQNKIDSLENELHHAYKPGLGEMMSNIQVHHGKLWFAGLHQNWQLADFEVHEIIETFDEIEHFQTDRKETKLIKMIRPALDSINQSIQQKNAVQFKKDFVLLTNTCNSCHHAVDFGFNVVKTPTSVPFSNQEF